MMTTNESLTPICRKFWTIIFCMVMLNFHSEFYTINMEHHLFQPCLLLYSINYNHSIPRLWSLSMLTTLLSSTYHHHQGIYVRDPWEPQKEWCHLCMLHEPKTDMGRAFYQNIIQKQKRTSDGKGLLIPWQSQKHLEVILEENGEATPGWLPDLCPRILRGNGVTTLGASGGV